MSKETGRKIIIFSVTITVLIAIYGATNSFLSFSLRSEYFTPTNKTDHGLQDIMDGFYRLKRIGNDLVYYQEFEVGGFPIQTKKGNARFIYEANSETFVSLNGLYGHDDEGVYWKNNKISNLHPSKVKATEGYYLLTEDSAYHKGNLLDSIEEYELMKHEYFLRKNLHLFLAD